MVNHQAINDQQPQGDFSCGLVQVETKGSTASQVMLRELVVIAAIVFGILFTFYMVVGQVLSQRCSEVYGSQTPEWSQCLTTALKGDSGD